MSQIIKKPTDSNIPGDVPISFVTDSGTAKASSHILNVNGGSGATTSAPGNSNQIVITVVGAGLVWNTISANQTLAVKNGYICISPGGTLQLALPSTSALGDQIEITIDGATSFQITQGSGQQIRFGNLQTTLGATGTITSTAQGDTIRLVCQTANLKWNALSSIGNLTIV